MANDVLAKMAVQISANNAEFNRKFSQSQKTLGTFTKGISNLTGTLKGLVAGFGAIEIGRQIIQTTSEFQKFAAVLKNTLGSDSAAERALSQIKTFAETTPFSVQELTSSFVKLANQGFIPTQNEMRKLGDLAASTGKTFDQLTEAIIDAQVGEFERLKEFGIRAKKEGDKVTFTFKGVKKQVDFTADSIQAYVLSLGDAIGVSGSMDAISKTLGGRISNLGDAWDNLMNSMGNSSSGPLFAVVESLTNIVNALSHVSNELALIGQAVSPFHDLRDVSKETLDYLLKFARTDTGKRMADIMKPFTDQNNQQFLLNFDANLKQFTQTLIKEGESIEDINTLWQHYVKTRITAAQVDNEAAKAQREANVLAQKESAEIALASAQARATEAALLQKLKDSASTGLTKGVTGKTGSDFLFDSGALTELANVGAEALGKLDGALQINSNSWDLWLAGLQARAQQAAEVMEAHQEKTMRLAEVAQTVGSSMGEAFGAIATGQEDLLQVMLRATEQIITMFLQQSIAAMIAAAMKDPSTPFPFAKIAIAAAGIAGVKALFAGLGASASGGGGRAGAPGRTPSEVGGRIVGRTRGYDLAYTVEKEGYRRGRFA